MHKVSFLVLHASSSGCLSVKQISPNFKRPWHRLRLSPVTDSSPQLQYQLIHPFGDSLPSHARFLLSHQPYETQEKKAMDTTCLQNLRILEWRSPVRVNVCTCDISASKNPSKSICLYSSKHLSSGCGWVKKSPPPTPNWTLAAFFCSLFLRMAEIWWRKSQNGTTGIAFKLQLVTSKYSFSATRTGIYVCFCLVWSLTQDWKMKLNKDPSSKTVIILVINGILDREASPMTCMQSKPQNTSKYSTNCHLHERYPWGSSQFLYEPYNTIIIWGRTKRCLCKGSHKGFICDIAGGNIYFYRSFKIDWQVHAGPKQHYVTPWSNNNSNNNNNIIIIIIKIKLSLSSFNFKLRSLSFFLPSLAGQFQPVLNFLFGNLQLFHS